MVNLKKERGEKISRKERKRRKPKGGNGQNCFVLARVFRYAWNKIINATIRKKGIK